MGHSQTRDQLKPHDHTQIVKAIMDNFLPVLRRLRDREDWLAHRKPTSIEMLRATLDVAQIDFATKDSIRRVIKILPEIAKTLDEHTQLPRKELAKAIGEIGVARSLQEILSTLAKLKVQYACNHALAIGFDVASEILTNGECSIYSADYGFYRAVATLGGGEAPDVMFGPTLDPSAGGGGGGLGGPGGSAVGVPPISGFGPVLAADAVGAAAGAAAGAVTGPGAAAGAVGGAVAASVGALLS